jgi:hypothetical protein
MLSSLGQNGRSLKIETEMLDETYIEAIKIISKPDFSVSIDHNKDIGELLWTIIADNTDEFSLVAFPTKEEALAFCEECGWKITSVSQDRTHYYQEWFFGK